VLADVLPYLACPHCGAGLTLDGQVRCARGHGFDVARQGYVNLLSGKASVSGDSAEMVAARAAFLDAGHYAPIMRAVAAAAGPATGCVADLGAGTGHYLAAVLDAAAADRAAGGGAGGAVEHTAGPFAARVGEGAAEPAAGQAAGPFAAQAAAGAIAPGVERTVGAGVERVAGAGVGQAVGTSAERAAMAGDERVAGSGVREAADGPVGLALEISKPALRRAARVHPRVAAVGCDTWGTLPVRDHAISVALNVFAPRNPAELDRILAADGVLVVASPTTAHLAELVAALDLLTVAPDKAQRVAEQLAPAFAVSTQDTCEYELALSHADVASLVGMGPSAWHVGAAALAQRVAALPEPVRTTASVVVTAFRRA
jgi:23S rRNA (guanine745-N1)-methyltransferase